MRLLPKQSQEILDAIVEARYELNKKEADFIQSVENAIKNDWRLSEKQSKWIQDIYAKSTEGKG